MIHSCIVVGMKDYDDEDDLAVPKHGGPRQYDADRGIRRGHYYDGLTASQQDELIIKLHNLGWSQSRIGRQLGMTQQGISKPCAASRLAVWVPAPDMGPSA